MSEILPVGADELSKFAQTTESLILTESERADLVKKLSNPLSFPKEFKNWLMDFVATNIPLIPISQVFGFTQFTALMAPQITTNESTSSTAFVALTTAGPTLTVEPGNYAVIWGAHAGNSASVGKAQMGISINSSNPADSDTNYWAVGTQSQEQGYATKTNTYTCPLGSNTITALYRTSAAGGNAVFQDRWMLAIKYANL